MEPKPAYIPCPACGSKPYIEELFVRADAAAKGAYLYSAQCPKDGCKFGSTGLYPVRDDAWAEWDRIVQAYEEPQDSRPQYHFQNTRQKLETFQRAVTETFQEVHEKLRDARTDLSLLDSRICNTYDKLSALSETGAQLGKNTNDNRAQIVALQAPAPIAEPVTNLAFAALQNGFRTLSAKVDVLERSTAWKKNWSGMCTRCGGTDEVHDVFLQGKVFTKLCVRCESILHQAIKEQNI